MNGGRSSSSPGLRSGRAARKGVVTACQRVRTSISARTMPWLSYDQLTRDEHDAGCECECGENGHCGEAVRVGCRV